MGCLSRLAGGRSLLKRSRLFPARRQSTAAMPEEPASNLREEGAAPALPDFYTDPNAVIKDTSSLWRFGKPPDYSRTRKVYAESKRSNHVAGSLPELVENLVKNWEIEASFKTRLSDWRTINQERYTFGMNGLPASKVDYMLKAGTYNAILGSNEFYCPEQNDMSASHKTFKRMMPTFAWEVLETYGDVPKVGIRWRHWGQMKHDYVAFNKHGEKVTAKAHGGMIDIQGVTVADVDEQMKIVHLETWFDPQKMFDQIAPNGVTKAPSLGRSNTNLGMEDDSAKREYGTHPEDPQPESSQEPDSPAHDSADGTDPTTDGSKRKASSQTYEGAEAPGCPFLKSAG